MYLAPALVIINAREYRNLTEHVSSIRQIIVLLIVQELTLSQILSIFQIGQNDSAFWAMISFAMKYKKLKFVS